MKKIIGIVSTFSTLALLLGLMACGGTTTSAMPIMWQGERLWETKEKNRNCCAYCPFWGGGRVTG
jgi:hypothetical protein